MHGTNVKCDFNKAINMHSRGPTEQHFYEGHRLAIILENVLVPPCSILLSIHLTTCMSHIRTLPKQIFADSRCLRFNDLVLLSMTWWGGGGGGIT